MGGEILGGLIIVGGIVALLLCGLVALIRLQGVNRRLERLEGEVSSLRAQARQAPPIPQAIRPAPEPRADASTAPAAPSAPPELPIAPPEPAIAPPEPRDLTLSLWPEELFRETMQAPSRVSAAAREPAGEPEPVLSGAEKPGSAAPFEIPAETPRPASRHRGYPRSGSAAPFKIPAETPRPLETPPQLPPAPPIAPPAPSGPSLSLEQVLGTKWLGWVGMVLVLVATAFFLKYAYDNEWIGKQGRLAIGTLASLAALVLGEHFRRKDWKALSQTLTGGGVAGLYICDYFSFRFYGISGQEAAFGIACLITALAVALAVIQDALPIAILALVGGFLSPPLLSTGENHPYALFTFITILDLVALGAAYFRRWRALDLLAYAGTTAMYMGWYTEFYGAAGQPSQMLPALLYTSVFYLLFLVIPSLHCLVRRLPGEKEGVILIVLNAIVSLGCYYKVLYPAHRNALGYVILGQALLVFALFLVWCRRLERDKLTAEALLVIGLALAMLAVPIRLRFYAVPLCWAAEGFLFLYLGVRYGRLLLRGGGALALILAVCGLLHRLPLHSLPFDPVFNREFGSWIAVAAAAWAAAWVLHRKGGAEQDIPPMAAGTFLAGFALICVALSMEVWDFWTIHQPGMLEKNASYFLPYLFGSLVVLWSLIASSSVGILNRARFSTPWMPLLWACHAVAVVFFMVGLDAYSQEKSSWLCLNPVFPCSLAAVVVFWWSGGVVGRRRSQDEGNIVAVAGHVLLAFLMAFELTRWSSGGKIISDAESKSLISAAWGLQALAIVAIGILRRNRGFLGAGSLLIIPAVGLLLYRVPLHDAVFFPVLNIPFIAWLTVIAVVMYASALLRRHREDGKDNAALAVGAFLVGFALICLALSLEMRDFWMVREPGLYAESARRFYPHLFTSMVVLWVLISASTVEILKRTRYSTSWMPLLWICHVVAVALFLAGLGYYCEEKSSWLLLNREFPFYLALILLLWWSGWKVEENRTREEGTALAVAGHFLLTVLLAFELARWWQSYPAVSRRLGISLISAAWAVQAFALVAIGLIRRNRLLRIVGFVLFGVTVLKVCLLDTSTLEPVYRIVSFGASGLLMLMAAYFYQRFSSALLGEKPAEEPVEKTP